MISFLRPVVLLAVLATGVGDSVARAAVSGGADETPQAPALAPKNASANAGVLHLLTYNIAGLPALLSGSRPALNIALMSPLLNHYDVVVTQEDFAYHSDLIRHARHGYRLPPAVSGQRLFGDGLSVLSAYPLASERRVRWEVCRGLFGEANDCFAEKGFSVAALQLTPAAAVDIYNLHADAGSGAGDRQARRAGFAQLAEYIRRHSKDRAVIVAGDMNVQSRHVADRRVLSDFAKQAGLTDACDAMRCGVQRLDRVLFRSSARVRLDAIAYRIDRRFVDTEGAHLSDHLPVGVELRWRVEG